MPIAAARLPDLGKTNPRFGWTCTSSARSRSRNGLSTTWPTARAEAVEQAKREMDLVRQVGGLRERRRSPAGRAKRWAARSGSCHRALPCPAQCGDDESASCRSSSSGLFRRHCRSLSEAAEVVFDVGHPEVACVLLDISLKAGCGLSLRGLRDRSAGKRDPRDSSGPTIRLGSAPGDDQRLAKRVSRRLHPPLAAILAAIMRDGGGFGRHAFDRAFQSALY